MEYNGYKLIADLYSSSVTLLVGLAWPAAFLILIYLLVRNVDVQAIQKFVNEFMRDKQSVEVSAGPKEGFAVKIVSLHVQSGLTQQIAKYFGQVSAEQRSAAQRAANSAAEKLLQQASSPPEARMTILWVDDHPQNNIGLQYAFQALGVIVVCVDTAPPDVRPEVFRSCRQSREPTHPTPISLGASDGRPQRFETGMAPARFAIATKWHDQSELSHVVFGAIASRPLIAEIAAVAADVRPVLYRATTDWRLSKSSETRH
ncbi:hypothetical protein [Bradyrhizobium sp.]|uniref:hypothetical protein n=1 Tax=Bradyrhizobium sp. TaxID=376 RepID=UPI0025C3A2B9|nr:hypothetical protein [Bradyrhizobium sp.]MBV8920302.1 hypothetical protein [Bradyrhizobium sp.]